MLYFRSLLVISFACIHTHTHTHTYSNAYLYLLIPNSRFVPPLPLSPLVTVSWFSILVSLFLFCCWCCPVAKSCLTLCNPMNCSMPGFCVLRYLLEFAQTRIHWVSGAIWPSHSLSPSSPFTFTLSQHQDLFLWTSSSHKVAKVLELQHQSFQWLFRVDFL